MDYIEFILGTFSILFGIAAIVISLTAFKKLTSGYLSTYVQWIIYSIFVFTLGRIWHTALEAFEWKDRIGVFMEYPEYIFAAIAFLLIAYASYRLYELSRVFGFKDKAKDVQRVIGETNLE
jgi:large-conductance mechanosensitive channel